MKQSSSLQPPLQAANLDSRSAWVQRLDELSGELGGEELHRLRGIIEDPERTAEAVRDALSTRLMAQFKETQSRACFGLIYELNSQHLLIQVAQRLRRYQSRADPYDLLQEVFFNIYRYPRKFDARRDDAFRVWTATIVRNTVLKHLRSLGRSGRAEVPFEDLSEQPETDSTGPLGGAMERESATECRRVYITYLYLYLQFYQQLSEREQRALELVEVHGVSYREAAADLGIKLENLKMVIFRARRKIYRAMRRVFDGLPPELRPARTPRSSDRVASSPSAGPTDGSTSPLAGPSGLAQN